MKTTLFLTLSLLISGLAFADAPAKAAPAKPAAQTQEAKPAEAKPAEPAAADEGAAHTCPCDKMIAGLKDSLAMHEGALKMLKKDPVLKVKGFKGKAKKMYRKKAKNDKIFHKSMARLLKKRIKFLEKMHNGGECKMHKAMQDAPDEVKAILKDRHAKMEERMKAHGAKMGAMHGGHE